MKKFLHVFCVLLLPFISEGQSNTDSLYSLKREPFFLNAFQSQDAPLALKLAQATLDTILRINPQSLELAAKWQGRIGAAYLQAQQCDSAVFYLDKSLGFYNGQKGPGNQTNAGVLHQNLGIAYKCKRDFVRAKQEFYLAIDLLKDIETLRARTTLLMTYGALTGALAENNEHDLLLREANEGIRLTKLYAGEQALEIGVIYLHRGLSFYNQGLLREARQEFEDALRQCNLNAANKNASVNQRFNLYNNLGGICFEMGDFEKAQAYSDTAIQVLQSVGVPDGAVAYLNAYANIAQSYLKLEDTTQALLYFQKAERLLDKTPDALAGAFITVYDGLGQTYLARKNPMAALDAHRTGLKKALERPGLPWQTAFLLYDIGVDFRALGQLDSAAVYLQAAVDTYRKVGGGAPTILAEIYRVQAEMAVEQSQWSKALTLLDSAALALSDTTALLADPTRKLQMNLESRFWQGIFLVTAELFLKKYIYDGNDFANLESAYSNLQSTRIWLERFRASLSAYNPVILQNILDYTRVSEAVLWEMYQKKPSQKIADEMFEVADRGKSLDLFERFRFVSQRDQLPLDSLIQNRISRADAQRLLAPDQCLLEYTVTDSIVYIFLLRPDGMLPPIVKSRDPRMDIWLKDLLTIVAPDTPMTRENAGPEQVRQAAIRFAKSANGLYQLLIAPVRPNLTRRVLVVPDGKLNNLPFELLLDTPPISNKDYAKLPYLIHDFDFGYCNSAVLFREMRARKYKATRPPLAIAPFDTWGNSTWPLLPGSRKALGGLRALMSCDTFLGINCTKAFLKANTPGRPLLYFFTHAEANNGAGKTPFLLLRKPGSGQPDSMYIGEVASLQLDAELVALSACETSLGELRRGEGNRGIAWAFTAAGAKSLATTLWKADVESATFIFSKFYTHLTDPNMPMTRDAALRQAKLDYLEKQEQDGEEIYGSQPYFWAPVILMGENERMKF